MKVREWMNRNVAGIAPSTTIGEALFTMLRHGLNGLPVVDREEKLLGIVTLSDIRVRILPSQEDIHKNQDLMTDPELLEARFLDVAKLPVKKIMTTTVVTASPGQALARAAALLQARKIKQVPVVQGGKVVGVVEAADVAWAFITTYRRHV